MSTPSEWAMGEASNVIGSAKDFSLDLESGYIVNNTEKYHASTITRIALALDAARKVPDGCVRLPDGRDAKVLGTLPMTADGCVIGLDYNGCLYREPVCGDIERQWPSVTIENINTDYYWYSTREAAEAARKEGTR